MRKHSTKFWIGFVAISALFLAVWYGFWQFRNRNLDAIKGLFGVLPVPEETRTDFGTVAAFADALLHTDGRTEVFLLLFQNNLELRPGGGFIGSFGILKVRDGHILDFSVHDTGNFDGRIPDTVAPPYPMKETLHIDSWKLRDSNYAPDFPTNADQAVAFYRMGGGEEQFDGVVGITTNVLASFLAVTGPVTLPEYPGQYGTENAILDLEFQVEQGYRAQGIGFGERKSVMGMLGNAVLQKAKTLSLPKQYELFTVLLDDLRRKDVQLSFTDPVLERMAQVAGWDGSVDQRWPDDYLMAIDANLGALKSDYYVKRSYAYAVDLSDGKPTAQLTVTYRHTATEKSYLTKDYLSFLRVYIPAGSFVESVTNGDKPVYGDDFGKKYVGMLVAVPLGAEKSVTIRYTLPPSLATASYDLKWQKQPGVNDAPASVSVVYPDRRTLSKTFVLNRDTLLSGLPK